MVITIWCLLFTYYMVTAVVYLVIAYYMIITVMYWLLYGKVKQAWSFSKTNLTVLFTSSETLGNLFDFPEPWWKCEKWKW